MAKYKCNKKYKKGGNWMSTPNPSVNPNLNPTNSYVPPSNSYNPGTNSSNMVSEATNWLDNIYKKIKTAIPSTSKTSTQSYQNPTNNEPSYPPYGASYGGKKTKKQKYGKKGGYGPSRSLTNIAAAAHPVNEIPTAKSQVWVGGKKLCTRRHKHKKSCKTRKSKRRM